MTRSGPYMQQPVHRITRNEPSAKLVMSRELLRLYIQFALQGMTVEAPRRVTEARGTERASVMSPACLSASCAVAGHAKRADAGQ
jgi:hypothetical protein